MAEVDEVFQEFRRSEVRIARIPSLYVVDGPGRARTLYFVLRRTQLRSDATTRASIADIGAAGFGALLSIRLQVGEEVRLEAHDAGDDAPLFAQDYVVRSVRKSREQGRGMDWVAGLQLMAGQSARLFQSFLQSLFIHHLLDSCRSGPVPERLRILFPDRSDADFAGNGIAPAIPAKGNVSISLDFNSIRRPVSRPAQPTEADTAGAVGAAAETAGDVILVAGQAERCCRAAQALDGLCFSEFEVPKLPLETCNKRLQCNCRLQSFAERRHDERRHEADRRAAAGVPAEPGRRLGVDRRNAAPPKPVFSPPRESR